MKAFLVTVMLARRVEELEVLMADSLPFMIFHKDKMSIRLHPKFVLNVVSDLHLN